MQKELIATYTDIMGKLATLPGEIEAVQTELTAAKLDLDRDERTVKEIKAQTMLTAEGSNAEKREADCAAKLKTDAVYQRWAQSADKGRRAVAVLADQVDSLTRQFAAVGYQSKLHAAMLAFLAESGAVSSVGDISFNMGSKPTGADGHITEADAADLGL